MSSRYAEVYQSWQKDPQAFWAEAARDIRPDSADLR